MACYLPGAVRVPESGQHGKEPPSSTDPRKTCYEGEMNTDLNTEIWGLFVNAAQLSSP